MRGIKIFEHDRSKNLRTVKTIREKSYDKDYLSAEDIRNNHIITKKIEPNEDFFSTRMLLKNYKTGALKQVTDRQMFVQYGEHVYYPETEWEELLTFKKYRGSNYYLYTWAMYLVPKDAKKGERFYIEDVIDDIVAERFWGGVYRAEDGVGTWDGKDIVIDKSLYDRMFLVG